jgi:hypothetical protein
MTSGTTFDTHALAALRTHPGAWHCMRCWAREANLNRDARGPALEAALGWRHERDDPRGRRRALVPLLRP